MFVNGSGDLGSISGRAIPKILKMVLDTSWINTQQYKVRIENKLSNPGKLVSPPLHLGVVAIEKGSLRVDLDYGRQQQHYNCYY